VTAFLGVRFESKNVDLVYAKLDSSDREVTLAIEPLFYDFFTKQGHL
jgi:hypothetical protein